jgi:hypothetical protein
MSEFMAREQMGRADGVRSYMLQRERRGLSQIERRRQAAIKGTGEMPQARPLKM